MIFKIAFKNVLSAGLRTWLNTFIISITLTCIILIQGMNNGLLKELTTNRIAEEVGNGQIWHQNYDPFDPLTLDISHGTISPAISRAVKKREAIPILMVAGSAYPQGRIFPAILKGIPPDQDILKLPFDQLTGNSPKGTIPAMIGKGMAKRSNLSRGDVITVRWRNSQGAFNAADLTIVKVFDSKVPAMDRGQIWLQLKKLQEMNLSPNHATIIISSRPVDELESSPEWIHKTVDDLLADTYQLVKNKSVGAGIFYMILIFLADRHFRHTGPLEFQAPQRDRNPDGAGNDQSRHCLYLYHRGSALRYFCRPADHCVRRTTLLVLPDTGLPHSGLGGSVWHCYQRTPLSRF